MIGHGDSENHLLWQWMLQEVAEAEDFRETLERMYNMFLFQIYDSWQYITHPSHFKSTDN